MKEYAKQFYSSKAWQECRKAYAKSKKNLCEKCLEEGLIVPGELVHHKIHISPNNIHDPNVTLDFNNLELLCRQHHMNIHTGKMHRYTVDELGRIAPIR